MLITRRSFLKYCAAATAALGLDPMDLRTAAGGVPGVGVDLRDLDKFAQVDGHSAAIGAGGEEKILGRLVFLGGQLAIVELGQLAAVAIP